MPAESRWRFLCLYKRRKRNMGFALELIITFAATVAFGILFNVPKHALAVGGSIGMVTWTVLQTSMHFGAAPIAATGLASLSAAIVAHVFAKRMRLPVTTLSIPGILPLVPGSRAYFTMLAFVEGNYIEGLEHGVETMLIAGAIAGGLVFSLSITTFGKGVGHRYESIH
ncbi:threonine/serine exporter family protein [Salisediminibacterium halotolerans]|nr:threonine/serine exporter family protein [Salisediminibacterium halotolerans]